MEIKESNIGIAIFLAEITPLVQSLHVCVN